MHGIYLVKLDLKTCIFVLGMSGVQKKSGVPDKKSKSTKLAKKSHKPKSKSSKH